MSDRQRRILSERITRKVGEKAPGVFGIRSRGTQLMRKNFWIILFLDAVLISFCYYVAHWLRFDGVISDQTEHFIKISILPLILIKLACFFVFDLYRGMWRYSGIRDLLNVLKASGTATILFIFYLASFYHFSGISRGVLLIDFLLTVYFIAGLRLIIRLYFQREQFFSREISLFRKGGEDKKRVLIIGTGIAAETLFRGLMGLERSNYRIIGFVDVEPKNKGLRIHGVPILGSLEDIPDLVSLYEIEDALIVESTLEPSQVAEIIESCEGLSVRFKVLPAGSVQFVDNPAENLRDVRIEDFLERDPVSLDMQLIRSELENQTVLVTGAGGSIGSELALQIFGFNPRRLILLDIAETPLYQIELELKKMPQGRTEVIPFIGDVRDQGGLEKMFRTYRPRFVYHAAAYKHVPMMELAPLEAVATNIFGTLNLANASCRHRVEKFILVSTDKAVRPTSVMGTTKRVAEMVLKSMRGEFTSFIVVRFGNVLASNGSVVPLFEKQIIEGGPVTVTHPEVRRYFMTISEAVTLILQAGSIGHGGELFLLDMGKPVKILDLARNMIRLAGLRPDQDVKIEFIGLRPGEKIYEELLVTGEGVLNTAFEKIKICNNAEGVDRAALYEALERFSVLMKGSKDPKEAVAILKQLVPEFAKNHYVPTREQLTELRIEGGGTREDESVGDNPSEGLVN